MKKVNESISDRIKTLRTMRGLKQDEMGKILGRSAMFVSRVEANRANLTDHQILVLAKRLGVNVLWLRTGEGFMTENEISRDCRSIGERIYQIRREKQLNQADFASLLGVSRNTISLLERRKINASPALIHAVIEKCQVDENWLRSGDRTDITEIEDRLERDPEARRKIINFLKRRYREEI